MTTPSRKTLSLAILCALLSNHALAAESKKENAKTLDQIVVTASPLGESADQTTQPVAVISGQELIDRAGAQAGAAVEQIPGVQGSFFGAGVSRPIIRGLEGARVQVLSGGISSMDASTVSPDHAVAIEPFLADQIEVLKGPATLFYGSGAIGGVVNIADGRLPEIANPGFTGRAELAGDTVANQQLGAVRMDLGVEAAAGVWQLHADGVYRDQDNYDVPGSDAPLEGTALESRNGAISASYLAEQARVGLSLSKYDALYGIPEAAEEAGGLGLVRPKGVAAEGVRIDLQQNRVDLSAALLNPSDFFQQIELRFGNNDYQHVELEGDELGTLFDVQSNELRIEAVHAPLIAEGKGAFGLTHSQRDFKAIGAEAFVPFSKGNDLGLFAVQHIESGRWHTDLGFRFDRVKLDAVGENQRTDNLRSLSASGTFAISDTLSINGNFDRAERAPVAEELFSEGAHVATQAYERGDPSLDVETANNVELGLHYHTQDAHFSISAYRNRFSDFIYQKNTGTELEALPLLLWQQGDATFHGVEAQASMVLLQTAELGQIKGTVQFDTVQASLDDGGNLPRIAPRRFGADLNWERGAWHARIAAMRYAKQDKVAEFETATDGYTRVDLDVSRNFANSDESLITEVFFRVRNATDDLARAHTSFLKEFAPLPGRNVGFGVRLYW